MPLSCFGAAGQETSVCRFKSVPTLWLCGPIDAARIFVLLSSLLSMLSGEIYLRLKLYLVVKISSDIVTEHCCQVCALSMMFCRSDCRLCADMVVSDCATQIRKLAVPRGLTLRQANVGYEKYYLHLIFPFYLNRDTSVLELFPVAVFQ